MNDVFVSVCVVSPQRASTFTALDIYCTRWRTADPLTASPSMSSLMSLTPLWVCTHWCSLWFLLWMSGFSDIWSWNVPEALLYFHFVLCVCVCVSASVLQSILSTEACKSGMPKVSELIQTPWVLIFQLVRFKLRHCRCVPQPARFDSR